VCWIKIPNLRTPQRPQPVFDPKWVCVHFIFCHTSVHTLLGPFIRNTYIEACGSNGLLGSVVQLYSCNVIQSVYTRTAFCCYKCTHFAWPNFLYKLPLPTHLLCTHCAWISCTAIHLYFSPASVYSGTVYTTALYKCTLTSASMVSVLSTNHRRASIYLLHSDWFF
jgi:hypothetical protein